MAGLPESVLSLLADGGRFWVWKLASAAAARLLLSRLNLPAKWRSSPAGTTVPRSPADPASEVLAHGG